MAQSSRAPRQARAAAAEAAGKAKQKEAAAKAERHRPTCPSVKHACQALSSSSKRETHHQTAGSLAFGGLLFAAGAAGWSLPLLFLLFAAVCLPWRCVSFWRQKWQFYLLDFCYFVNVLVAAHLLFFPDDPRFEAAAYALSDGPLAAALVAWQCPWVFGSAEHTVSVLMHLLPGLAVFAHRYHTPSGLRGWRGIAGAASQLLAGERPALGTVPPHVQPQPLALWLFGAPLAFYGLWQATYFLLVQVAFRPLIRRGGYETSYTCLARRAAKTNNFWNRLVRRGGAARRILVYGALQLAYTVAALAVFTPTYFSWPAAFLFQVVKVVFPVYYGSRYLVEKVPQHKFLEGIAAYEKHKASAAGGGGGGQGPSAAAAGEAAAAAAAGGARPPARAVRRRQCAAEALAPSARGMPAHMGPRPVAA